MQALSQMGLIAIIIHEYLTLRMRGLAKNEMLQIRDEEKLNAARKKMSRLCSTCVTSPDYQYLFTK